VQRIWHVAKKSIGCYPGKALFFQGKMMVEDLEQVCEAIKALKEKIKEICSEIPEYDYLLTIPGFGPDTSSKVIAAIGDPHRFTSGKQVLKMAGLDLSASRSGARSNTAIGGGPKNLDNVLSSESDQKRRI
jgi:transposase